MGTPAVCPHDNQVITTEGPYFRQVHPNHFQDGRALLGSFILKDTGCHYGLSLNDGVRTTAARCHGEYIQNSEKLSAAVLAVSEKELMDTGAFVIVDSPDEITFAHVDALYMPTMSNSKRKGVDKALMAAANKRSPAYIPNQ